MVGDVCDVDWLGQQLTFATSWNNDGTPSSPGLGRGGSESSGGVMVLDCRSPVDYQTCHILGAVHLAVPTLMLRRLTTGNLPVSSVISCLQSDDSNDQLDCRWKSDILVLHDECSSDVTDDVISGSTPLKPCHVVSVLLRRLKEEGFRVCLLDGGYAAFSRKYPHLCVTSLSRDDCEIADMSTVLGLHRLRLQQQQQQQQQRPTTDADLAADDAASPRSVDAASTVFPVEVLPFLYLGNARSSADLETLYRNGIKFILNVTPDVPNAFANNDQFHYLQIPINDHWSQNMAAYFPDAIAFIDEARHSRCGVLVHCLAGISRSVTVTVAYLMRTLNMSLNDAYDHVKRCKPDVSPNFSFMGQLMDYERALRSTGRCRSTEDDDVTTADLLDAELCSACQQQQELQQQAASSDVTGAGSQRRCACATLSTGSDGRTCYSSPASSLSSLSTSSAASTTLSSSSSASSSAFDYEIPTSNSASANCSSSSQHPQQHT